MSMSFVERYRKISNSKADLERPEDRVAKKVVDLKAPEGLKVTRRVGADSLLLAWTPTTEKDVTGFTVRLFIP